MRIYAIRDRLIDYYQRPFVADGDKVVLASLSEAINNEKNETPLAKAPHHFEVHLLGEIDGETGEVTAKRELIATCDSLVRERVRIHEYRSEPREFPTDGAPGGVRLPLGGDPGRPGARRGVLPGQEGAEAVPRNGAQHEAQGSSGGHDPYDRRGDKAGL